MDAGFALGEIHGRSWPEQVLCLAEPVISDSLPGFLSAEDKEVLQLLTSLGGALQALASQLEVLSKSGISNEIRDASSSLMQKIHTNLATNDAAPKDITSATVKELKGTLASVRSISQETSNNVAMEALTSAQKTIGTVDPRKDSQLLSLIRNVEKRLQGTIVNMGIEAYNITKNNSPGRRTKCLACPLADNPRCWGF